MMHPTIDIKTFLKPGVRAHLAGIGGVSMCPLAEVLLGMGLIVQGSDMTESDTVCQLRAQGIDVAIGHSAENLKDCDLVIRTAAIHDENPEIAGAIARGIPVYERAQAWGAIMQHYENAVCFSGTHGKTTTTSMATHIFMAAQADPTVMIGGTLPMLHAGYRVGKGDTIILESCEYCNSFLNFFPTVAVILNVGEDHLDFFKDLKDIEHSFHAFADLVPQRGYVISNADDQGAREAVAGLSHPVFTFSLADRTADCYARDVAFFDGCASFDVMIHGQLYAHVDLHIPGKHNILNALAAADEILIPVQCEYFALEGLSDLMTTLRMVKRRINPGLGIFGVALTMYDGRTNFSAQVAEEVRRHFPGKVFTSVIPRNVRLAEAPSHGVPVGDYDRSSRGAAAYRAMAEEVKARL